MVEEDIEKIQAISQSFTDELQEEVDEQIEETSQMLADSGRGFDQELAEERTEETFENDSRVRINTVKHFSETVEECGRYDDREEVIACSEVKARESGEELGNRLKNRLGLR
jgi:hypothetical protein